MPDVIRFVLANFTPTFLVLGLIASSLALVATEEDMMNVGEDDPMVISRRAAHFADAPPVA